MFRDTLIFFAIDQGKHPGEDQLVKSREKVVQKRSFSSWKEVPAKFEISRIGPTQETGQFLASFSCETPYDVFFLSPQALPIPETGQILLLYGGNTGKKTR